MHNYMTSIHAICIVSKYLSPSDVHKIELGTGEKLGLFFQWIAAFFAGFIIGFVYGWKLTLVILAVSPLLVICGIVMSKVG